MTRLCAASVALLLSACGGGATLASRSEEPAALAPESVVAIRPAAPAEAARGGRGEILVALSIAAGYHVMSDRPSDKAYIPTHARFDAADGVTLFETRYPSPVAFKLVDREIATFQGDVEMRVPFEIAEGAAPGERTLRGTLRYQSCTEARCLFPVTRRIEASVRVLP